MSGDDPQAASVVDWMPARQALSLVQDRNGPRRAEAAIATRAHAGHLRASADLFRKQVSDRRGDKKIEVERQVELPAEFWWAEGAAALEQNWQAGDFSTWIEQHKWQAFGVSFDRAGIDAMLAPPSPAGTSRGFADETASVESSAAKLPTDEAIKAKMLELKELGVKRDVAAILIRQISGFEAVGNETARRVVNGELPRGRPKKARQN